MLLQETQFDNLDYDTLWSCTMLKLEYPPNWIITKKEITVLQHVIRLSAHAACYFGRDFACEQSREAVLILLHLLVG